MNIKTSISLFALLLGLSVPLLADRQGEEAKLHNLAQRFLDKCCEFDPVYATQLGLYSPEYLHYPDFSRRALGNFETSLKGLRRDLKKVDRDQLSVEGKIDCQLLESDIATRLLLLERSPLLRDNPKQFSATAINGIYFLLISASHPDSVKLEMILKRLEDLPRFLGSARDILKDPPRLWSVLAESEADKGLEMLNETAAYFSEIVPSRSPEIEQRFGEAAAALELFLDLTNALQLVEDSDFALGRENYDQLLRSEYFLDFDSDSLLRLGESLFDEAIVKYDSVKAIIDTLPPVEERTYFIPTTFSRQDILDYFQWEINQSRDWVANTGYATVPADIGDCEPVETPAFLRNIIGGIAYEPAGSFAPVQRGLFYVNPLPDSLDESSRSAFFRYCMQRGFRSSTVHEAYPGHHLQLQTANRNPSLIRRLQQNNMMVEGWALYCEETTYENGFYGDDPRAYLNILSGVVFRAARIIVDVKLHTGQFTYQDAVGWMTENLGADVEYVETEVSRYTLDPTQPMSYLVGKLMIEDLRDLYESQMNENYSLTAFHDMLLAEGSIPPKLIYLKLTGGIK